ncbi:tetratricopeptide repeat protein [Sandaracinus amylolyticus]|uniref:tetratricopeptide repeat protein n=1 Tax=Sandaracinus amylolyticus TaxID=927083 RepID=UPI001F487078|nr:tetratricopeptide repeat protein [Sandaracinus amylolyticus]UJR86510.1 Hypothetical protein I5071_86050 [Sandaracinus amylolyticus]
MAEGPEEQTARAKRLIAERNYDEAIRVSRRALLTRPDLVEVRLLLGQALLVTGRYEQVRVEMMALARKHPNLAELHRILGEAYLRAGQTPKAKESLRRAVELDAHDTIARDLLREAVDEESPLSHTIQRWFGEDEPKTVEQALPPQFDDPTPAPASPRVRTAPSEPSVQVDPALAEEAAAAAKAAKMPAAPKAAAPAPRPIRKPTMMGMGAVPPPRAPAQPARAPQRTAAPQAAAAPQVARSAPPPARASVPPPPMTALPHVGEAGPTQPVPALRTNGHGDVLRDAATVAHGRARRALDDDPPTDEIALEEPTRSRSDRAEPEQDEDDDAPTLLGRRPDSLAPAPASRPPPARLPPVAPIPRSVPPPAAPPRAAPPPSAPPPARPSRPPEHPGALRPAMRSAPPPAIVPPQDELTSSETLVRDAAVARPFLGGRAAEGMPPEPPTDPRRVDPAPIQTPQIPIDVRAQVTTESTRRRPASIARMVVLVVLGLVVIGLAGVGVRTYLRRGGDAAIRSAAAQASSDGRRTSVERAIATIDVEGADAPWRIALRARLLATLTLEHAEDRATEVEVELSRLERDGAALADARIARSLLLVAQGRGPDALGVLSGLAASGEELAEAFRARAWAAASAGRVPEAEESARQALTVRPGAPRHAAMHAVLRFAAGDASSALGVLDSVPNGATSPAVRVARARVLLESGGDPVRAAAEADAVLTELAPSASAVELGWAYLVRAQLAARRGAQAEARAAALEAASRTPAFDEGYGLSVVETLLEAEAPSDARDALARLPSSPVDPTRRAMLVAEVALASNDLAGAETALMSAGAGAHAELLRARVAEARGELDTARQLYDRAAGDPREALEARTLSGAVLLRMSRPREARAQLDHALRLAPADVRAVALFVRAALATGDAAAAETAIQAALAHRPDAIELVAARGSVLLALGRIDEALAALQRACEVRPEDAELRAELGEAGLRAGRRDVAASAFQEALRLSPGLARALVGSATLAIDDARFDEASASIEQASQAGAAPLDLARLRADLAVARGLGHGAIASIEPLVEENRRDGPLLAALAHLHAQAEDDREARDLYTRAVRADDDNYEALLGRAGVEMRRGDLGGSARSIDRAERAGRQRGASTSFFARVSVARARLRYEVGDLDEARRLAQQAISADPRCSEAHLLLANVAIERNEDPIPHFRASIAGTRVMPEAVGRLAIRLERGDEACTLARRYIEAAPRGYDRDEVDGVQRRCH